MAINETLDAAGGYMRDAVNAGNNAANKIGDAWRSGLPPSAPVEVPASTGSARFLAEGARSIGGAALRAAPGVAGFISGSGLMDGPATRAAVGANNQQWADVPPDYSPEAKASMAAQNTTPTPQRELGSPFVEYLRRSRDGLMAGPTWEGVRGSLEALPGGSALSAVGNLAGVGAKVSRMAGMLTEGAMLDKAGFGLGRAAKASELVPRSVADPATASTARSANDRAKEKMAGIAQGNPELFGGSTAASSNLAGVRGSTTSAPGIFKQVGGQYGSTPMFTDDPNRAANEYAGNGVPTDRLTTVQSTANSDRSFLNAAFQEHINSGDLSRAAATAVTPEDRAALGIAYRQHQQAQAQAAQQEPLQRMLMEQLNKSPRERALEEDPRTRAFSGVSGRRSAQPQGGAVTGGNMQELLQALASQQKGGQEQSPMALALAQSGLLQQQQLTQKASGIDNALKLQQLNAGKLMESLRATAMNETDPTKRASAIEALLAAQGKSTKDNPNRIIKLTVPFGKANELDGKQPTRDVLWDMDAGKMIDPAEHVKAAEPSREQLVVEAKAAVAKGATKEAVNAHSMKLFGFAPL